MYPAVVVSLACLVLSCLIGIVLLMIIRGIKRRKEEREEKLMRQIKDLTGQDYVKGHTTVKDLEERYGKKG